MSDTKEYILRNGELVEFIPIEKICQMILEHFNILKENNYALAEKNAKLKDEHYKNSELAKLKEAYDELIEDYHRGFGITEDESLDIKKWIRTHDKSHRGSYGVSGGKYIYEFVPTSIGTIGHVRCSCGESFCFRDL